MRHTSTQARSPKACDSKKDRVGGARRSVRQSDARVFQHSQRLARPLAKHTVYTTDWTGKGKQRAPINKICAFTHEVRETVGESHLDAIVDSVWELHVTERVGSFVGRV